MPAQATPKCPICGAPRAAAFRPFCSRRCAQVDLGRWFAGAYAVPGAPAEAEDGAAEPRRQPRDEA